MSARLRIVPANRIEAVHVAGGEVRERHVEVLDAPPTACAGARGRGQVDAQRQGADDAALVIGCERDARAQVWEELAKFGDATIAVASS